MRAETSPILHLVLRQRGVLSAQRGRGTFVTRRTSQTAAGRRRALVNLARQYVEDARWHMFSDAEIQAALDRIVEQRKPAA
jgi:DNA-binding transcriptional regulator YhcF (GntR family)